MPALPLPMTTAVGTKMISATAADIDLADTRTTCRKTTADMAATETTTMMTAPTGASQENADEAADLIILHPIPIWETRMKMRGGLKR